MVVATLTRTQVAMAKVFVYGLLLFLIGVLHLDPAKVLLFFLGASMAELVIYWWRES